MRKIFIAVLFLCCIFVTPVFGQEKINVEHLNFTGYLLKGLRSSLKAHEFVTGNYRKLFENEKLRVFAKGDVVIIFINGIEITQYNSDKNTLVRINLFSNTLFRKEEHHIEGFSFPLSETSR